MLCYLFSYINLLMSNLWLDLDLWFKLHNKTFDLNLMFKPWIQKWYIAFSPYAPYPMPSCHYNCYYYLFLISFICFWSYKLVWKSLSQSDLFDYTLWSLSRLRRNSSSDESHTYIQPFTKICPHTTHWII